MNKIALIILAVLLSVLCFFADRHFIKSNFGSVHYKEPKEPEHGDDEYPRFDHSAAAGLTVDEFEELFGDTFAPARMEEEYSDTVPEGHIIRSRDADPIYRKRQLDGRFPIYVCLSKGKAPKETDLSFRNLVDCDEYFSQFDGEVPMYGDEYLVSHNEFYMADGQLCTVEITSVSIDTDDTAENSGQPPLDRNKPVFTGRKNTYFSPVPGETAAHSCAYSSNSRGALEYIYNGYFSLLPDDYNGDCDPDYIIRVCDPGSEGSYYYMECMTSVRYAVSESLPTVLKNADDSFYVYGENAPSIRLDRIDRETVFYLTKNVDEIVPVILNSDLHAVNDSFSVNGKLYSSFYENGVLSLKCTCLDLPDGYSEQEETVQLSLRKLNDRMWEETDITAETSFRLRSCSSDEVKTDMPLEKGVYRMEIHPESGGIAVTEFVVR